MCSGDFFILPWESTRWFVIWVAEQVADGELKCDTYVQHCHTNNSSYSVNFLSADYLIPTYFLNVPDESFIVHKVLSSNHYH